MRERKSEETERISWPEGLRLSLGRMRAILILILATPKSPMYLLDILSLRILR